MEREEEAAIDRYQVAVPPASASDDTTSRTGATDGVPQGASPTPPTDASPDAARAQAAENERVEQQIRRMSRRSFLWGSGAVAGALGALTWLRSRRQEDGIPWPLRRTLEVNEDLSRDYFSDSRLAKEQYRSLAEEPRPNGDIGLDDDFDPATWKLTVEGVYGATEPIVLTLAQVMAMPEYNMTTELKCIEGWSTVVHWSGARLADLIARHPPPVKSGDAAADVVHRRRDLVSYVSLETPGGGYYVGLDMESALHPQTLLCYAMNGSALTTDHGAPLRLVIPVKYGIKHIKRIGTIRYTNTRPADYWAERGYDWYAGH